MSDAANYCLKGPNGKVVGFRLGLERLGHEIYDILDWAEANFPSHFVEQTEDCVYVCSEAAREALEANDLRAEPLSVESSDGGGSRDGGPSGGGFFGGGSSGGGSSGGGSSGPGGNVPAGSDGGKTIAAGR